MEELGSPADGNEDREPIRQNFQVQRKGRPGIAVHVCPQRLAVGKGDARLFHVDHREHVASHLQACQKHGAVPQEMEPVHIVEEGELDDTLIAVLRREEVAEAACRVGEHGCHEGGGHRYGRAPVRLNKEAVGLLPGQGLQPLDEVRQRSQEGLFLDAHLAHGFGNESCRDDIDEVPAVDFPYVDARFLRRFKHADGTAGRAGDVERPGEVIYRTEGDEGKRGGAVHLHHAVDDLVDGAVAAHADDVKALFGSLAGKLGRVASLSCDAHDDAIVAFVKHLLEHGQVVGRPLPAGGGIENDDGRIGLIQWSGPF